MFFATALGTMMGTASAVLIVGFIIKQAECQKPVQRITVEPEPIRIEPIKIKIEPIENSGLTVRQLEILSLIASGESNKLIARALDLSPNTVKRHVANILSILGKPSRMHAAEWYRTHSGA